MFFRTFIRINLIRFFFSVCHSFAFKDYFCRDFFFPSSPVFHVFSIVLSKYCSDVSMFRQCFFYTFLNFSMYISMFRPRF